MLSRLAPWTQLLWGLTLLSGCASVTLEPPVATTARFALYSRFRMNLHDRLVRWAQGDERKLPCASLLSQAQQRAWEDAVVAFHQFESPVSKKRSLRVRFHLTDPGLDLDESLGVVPAWYTEAMTKAAPIYRRCWWKEDDANNRAWIQRVVPLLEKTEAYMASKIASAHQLEWRTQRFPVDLVPYVNFGGGNTVLGDPPHTMLSTAHGARHPFEAVEMLFHEASHTMLTPRSGGVLKRVRDSAKQDGRQVHRDFWHALLFYVAGDAAQKAAKELLGQDYIQYMYPEGLFERAWPELAGPLETSLQPYLDGKTDLATAAKDLALSVSKPGRAKLLPEFMAGCWRSVQGRTIVTERWSRSGSGLMVGTSQTQRGDRAIFHEYLRIEATDKGAVYLAQPKGKSPAVAFAQVDASAVHIAFENLKHDFPKRIEYTREGKQLSAKISSEGGESRQWRYWSVPCERR